MYCVYCVYCMYCLPTTTRRSPAAPRRHLTQVIDICPCWYKAMGAFQYDCCYKSQKHPKAGQLQLDLSFWVRHHTHGHSCAATWCCARTAVQLYTCACVEPGL